MQWNYEESLNFELLILKDKCYNEHHPLENDDIYYMTIFTYFLKWRCNRVGYGQHYSHLKNKTICSNKKVNENGYKHKENVEKKVDQSIEK